jgi:hypothetical protein
VGSKKATAGEFQWNGDLADDCYLRIGNMFAHVECLGHSTWFAWVHHGKVTLLNTADSGGAFKSGHHARATCESVIATYGYGYNRGYDHGVKDERSRQLSPKPPPHTGKRTDRKGGAK